MCYCLGQIIFNHPAILKQCKQESPPAWTQEAYRPPCSEYSFCCPILADPPPWLTPPTPPGWLTWLPWLTDPPPPADWPDPPSAGWLTPPPPRLDWPPQLDWPPPAESADWPPPCRQTDRHVSKHYLPVVLRTRVVTTHNGFIYRA